MAKAGDEWAVDQLLKQPPTDADTRVYLDAWRFLARDRRWDVMSLGMAGSLRLPLPIRRGDIRIEGVSRHYADSDLEDFVEIVAALDDVFVEVRTKQEAEIARRLATKGRPPR